MQKRILAITTALSLNYGITTAMECRSNFIKAIENNNFKAVKTLYESDHIIITDDIVEKAKDPEIRKYLESKPHEMQELLTAVYAGKLDAVKTYCEEYNADIEIKDCTGHTPIMIASRLGYSDIVKYLQGKRRISIVNAKDELGETSLFQAIINGHLDTVKHLYEKCHVSVEMENNAGNTPIHIAATNGHLEIVQYLAEECHANTKRKNQKGNTAVRLAAAKGHLDVVKYLIEICNAKINTKNNYGHTAINLAISGNHLDVVKYLVEKHHAKISPKDIRRTKNAKMRTYLKKHLKSREAVINSPLSFCHYNSFLDSTNPKIQGFMSQIRFLRKLNV